jgi:hypothetical protein
VLFLLLALGYQQLGGNLIHINLMNANSWRMIAERVYFGVNLTYYIWGIYVLPRMFLSRIIIVTTIPTAVGYDIILKSCWCNKK